VAGLSKWGIDTTLLQKEYMSNYFGSYRNEGFAPSIATAKNIAPQLGVEPSFPVKW
jgi:hypothetical protein